LDCVYTLAEDGNIIRNSNQKCEFINCIKNQKEYVKEMNMEPKVLIASCNGYGFIKENELVDPALALIGEKGLILNYASAELDFVQVGKALNEKKLQYEYFTITPNPENLRKLLNETSQLWIISYNKKGNLNDEHVKIISEFYNNGGSLYIFGSLFLEGLCDT